MFVFTFKILFDNNDHCESFSFLNVTKKKGIRSVPET